MKIDGNNKIGDEMELFIHSARTVIYYIYLVILVRVLGKREVGKLGIFDLVIILLVANLASISIENIDIPFWYFLFIIAIIAFIQKIVSLLELKVQRLRGFFNGKLSVVVFNGKLCCDEMKKNLYNIDDLLIQLRNEKIDSINKVKIAILEHTGTLSVYTYEDTSMIPLPAIVSGKIVYENLYYLGLDEDKLISLLEDKKLASIKCAYYDKGHLIYIDTLKRPSVKKKKRQ